MFSQEGPDALTDIDLDCDHSTSADSALIIQCRHKQCTRMNVAADTSLVLVASDGVDGEENKKRAKSMSD